MENPLQLCRFTDYKASIVIIGDIVRIMQNRPKLVSLEIVRDIGDVDGAAVTVS